MYRPRAYLWLSMRSVTLSLPQPLRRKRERLYTRAEVAEVLGVSRATIERLEGDPLSVNVETLVRYLSLFGWRVRIGPRDRRFADDGGDALGDSGPGSSL